MSSDAAPSQEYRQDLLTKQWVIVAPTRNQRPQDIEETLEADPADRTPVEGCPFCPGHEEMLPRILWALNGSPSETDSETDSETADWRTRVVPNKYPALTPDPDPHDYQCGLYRSRAGIGQQEVVIDTPYHHQTFAQMPVEQVDAVLRTYLERYRALRGEGLIPFVFRNHGSDAGASLPHPHSQIIAPQIEPPLLQQEERQAQAHEVETGTCPYCEMIEQECRAEARIVCATDAFVAFVPYAARVPYETWILPRTHEPEFGRLGAEDRTQLAEVLQTVLHGLHVRGGNPDYNFFVRTALDHESDASHLHWSLRIYPRTTVDAGFELGTGMKVNPSLPERDAEVLRG